MTRIKITDEIIVAKDNSHIEWDGRLYRLQCGAMVYAEAGQTYSCVKPVGHKSHLHEDETGYTKEERRPAIAPDTQLKNEIQTLLIRSGLDSTEVYNAMNALLQGGIQFSKSSST